MIFAKSLYCVIDLKTIEGLIMQSYHKHAVLLGLTLIGAGLIAASPTLAADANPIFGQATTQKMNSTENKTIKGKGYYADLYGYYGNYYNNQAGLYGLYGTYYKNSSYYSTASTYAGYASTYYGYASSYQASGQ